MFQRVKRGIAVVCTLALIITMLPVSANAAAKPKFAKTYREVYENGTEQGVYTYTVKNLTKGQTVKWSLSGTGKSYAKLAKSSTKASSTSVSNKLTIKTNGKSAAKNKIVNVTAKVYSKAGKLQYTLSAGDAKIQIKATKVTIQSDALSAKQLYIGESYQFQYKLTPANATSTNTWSVTRSDGANVSSYITQGGVFTPQAEGTYTIKATTKNGSSKGKSASKKVVVGPTMTEAKQTAANKVVAVFSSNAKNLVDQNTFTIRDSNNVRMDIKDIAFSEDGKEVTLTTYTCLEDDEDYTLTDGIMERRFTAKVGKPALMRVLTTQATVGKATAITYGVYDANNIEVSAAYPGTVKYDSPKITNGYLIDDKDQIYMTNIGDVGTFTMTYTCQADPAIVLTAYAQVTCTAASIADETNFTLTADETVPDYSAASYKDNRKVAAGGNYYIHFRALDTDKGELKYDSVVFESSDPDTLLVNNRANGIARVTAIKNGTVKIVVTASYGKQTYVYSYEVTVVNPPHLQSLSIDRGTVFISNRVAYGYKEYINVTALDQYGDAFALNNESFQITDNSTYKPNIATYDPTTNRVEISTNGCAAGTYSYTLTLTVDGQKASVTFTVVVQTPPSNGAVSYQLDIDNPVIDLALTSDTDLTDPKTVTIRMAEYRGGIFYDYVYIQSVKVMKDGMYYSADLTQAPSSKESEVTNGSGQYIPLTVLSLKDNTCTKAPTGVYRLEIKFLATSGSSSNLATITGAFEIKDSQITPEITVARNIASTPCKTALELAQNCLAISGAAGAEIVDCTVTGTSTAGSIYAIGAGESVNIRSITIQVKTKISGGKEVVSTYTVNVGKTLRNA